MRRLQLLGQHAAVVRAALTAAEIANRLILNLKRKGCVENPRLVRRVLLFETDGGVDYGFAREEFGGIEPFLSVPVGLPTSESDPCEDSSENP